MFPSPSVDSENEEENLFEHYRYKVDPGQSLLRIDKYLLNRIEGVSRNKIQQAAAEGMIIVNGKPQKSNYKVRPEDVITIMLPDPRRHFQTQPEKMELEIVHEDADLILVNKPAGMVMHPAPGNYTGTLVNGLLFHFENLPSRKQNEFRPGLVHRIDKDTSGVVVVAKNEASMNALAKQFFDHSIQRSYWALAWGDFKNEEGTIIGHIGRSTKDRKKMDVFEEGEHGKEAVTHYKVIERFNYVTLLECRLETGRTHQIRVHMKYAGHPLFNDETYGGNRIVKGTVYTRYRQFVENCFAEFSRQALHAKSLGFIHPGSRQPVYFETALPLDFDNLLSKWRKYIGRSGK